LAQNIELQEQAIESGDLTTFHALDYDFHKLIYVLSGNPAAFDVMLDCKQKVDRLCLLSLEKSTEATSILAEHRKIADNLASRDLGAAQDAVRAHLSRLDKTIESIHATHPNYFE